MLLSGEPTVAKQKSSTMLNRFIYERHPLDDMILDQSGQRGSRQKEMAKYLDDWQEKWDKMAKKADGGANGEK